MGALIAHDGSRMEGRTWQRARPAALVVAVLVASVTPIAQARVRASGGDAARGPYRIAVAGDIACASDPGTVECRYDDTADLVVGAGFTSILLLGDNQYDRGELDEYRTYFDPTWGRALELLRPVPGNHEYAQDPTARPRGYFRYFGRSVRGPDGLGYYSFDVGACPDAPCWHVVALSSQLCFAPGGCGPAADPANPGPGNRMYEWLRDDLAAHPNSDYPCTIATWHHPLFSISTGSGATAVVRPLWDLLYAARADIVLNGHSHNYQRWKPQDPDGASAPGRGIREFVVGTGGSSLYALQGGDAPDNLATAQDRAFGVVAITLSRAGYAWEWLGAAGQPRFTDTRRVSVACV